MSSLSQPVPFKFGQETRRIFLRRRSIDPIVTADLRRDRVQRELLLQALPNVRACLV
jgi:hypothetical protein